MNPIITKFKSKFKSDFSKEDSNRRQSWSQHRKSSNAAKKQARHEFLYFFLQK
jgi:hypothetical protein